MADNQFIEKVYNLKRNPFTNWVDPNVEMAGRKTEKAQWEDLVRRKKSGRANAMCFIVGEYGFGKTLALNKIVEGYQKDKEILSVYVKMLSEDRTTKFGVDFIQRIFRGIPEDIFARINLTDIDVLIKYFPEPARIFRQIALKGEGGRDFLCGLRSFSAAELKKMGIAQRIASADIAKKYLLCFLYLLAGIDIKALLLAVDETEYVFSQLSGAGIAQVWNSLRDMYDLQSTPRLPVVANYSYDPANMIFFFAISEGGWTNFQKLSKREQAKPGPVQPLMRRMERAIQLQPLNKKETKELITKRLSRDRATGNPQTKPLIPFDESFVQFVYERSLGNPSEIVKYCDFALEDGLREGVKLLNAEFAKMVFSERGLIIDE